MRTMLKAAALACATLSPALATGAAHAQAVGGGAAVLDVDGAIQESAAYKTAAAQIQTTYKAQMDAFTARKNALQAELEPMQREIQTLQANPATSQATLQAKASALQARGQAAQQELGRLAQPFQRPFAYAQEQVGDKLDAAIKAAMAAKKVAVLVTPQAVLAVAPGANLTPDVVAQLNLTVKTVSITPPAGWQPGQNAQAAAQPQGR